MSLKDGARGALWAELGAPGATPSLAVCPQAWLSRFGYLPPGDPTTGQLQAQEELSKAIATMQRFGGLEATGVLGQSSRGDRGSAPRARSLPLPPFEALGPLHPAVGWRRDRPGVPTIWEPLRGHALLPNVWHSGSAACPLGSHSGSTQPPRAWPTPVLRECQPSAAQEEPEIWGVYVNNPPRTGWQGTLTL